MTLVSTILFPGMPDIMVWPEIILAIALWVKFKMATITVKVKLCKLASFSTEWTVYDWVFRYSRHIVWLESTLDIALWVKSKMAAICENQKII